MRKKQWPSIPDPFICAWSGPTTRGAKTDVPYISCFPRERKSIRFDFSCRNTEQQKSIHRSRFLRTRNATPCVSATLREPRSSSPLVVHKICEEFGDRAVGLGKTEAHDVRNRCGCCRILRGRLSGTAARSGG